MLDFIPSTFASALSFTEVHGYVLIFLIMVIEGPIITTAAAFAASLGYFNIFIIFLLSLLGDLTGDGIHYIIGRVGRVTFVERLALKLGLKKRDLRKLENTMHKHFGKSMIIIKFIPIFTNIGLLLTGALKVPPKKFVWYSFIITLPRTIFFVVFGFYFGMAVDSTLKYFKLGGILIPISIISGFFLWLAVKNISRKFASKIEDSRK